MGLMDKFKNLFTEEVEEVKPIKKEVRHVEISAPKKEIEPVQNKEENTISDSTAIKKEEKFVFPVYFDDKDFDDLEKPKEIKKETKPEKNTKGAYNGSLIREMQVEEKKSFKPSLIISPVYGVLDKNYHKEDITTKTPTSVSYYKKQEDMTVDDIRDKAYGTLEDELKNNVLGNEELLNEKRENTETAIDLFNELDFEEIDKKEQANNLENNDKNNNSLLFNDTSFDDDTAFLAQQLEEQKKKLDEINEYIQENTVEKKKEVSEPVELEDKSDSVKNEDESQEVAASEEPELVENESEVIELEEANVSDDTEKEPDLTESELFNLIDSMYDDKEEA